MLRRVRDRLAGESGFTLVELLVVILIIGILSAIVLPQFFVHRDKAEDADAKTDVRSLVTEVESCYVVEQDYTKCDEASELRTSLELGTAAGQVYVHDTTPTSYIVTAVSKGTIGGTHKFHYTRAGAGTTADRTCEPDGKGGCPVGAKW
jgi:type IV pilus assembly protein PilA